MEIGEIENTAAEVAAPAPVQTQEPVQAPAAKQENNRKKNRHNKDHRNNVQQAVNHIHGFESLGEEGQNVGRKDFEHIISFP